MQNPWVQSNKSYVLRYLFSEYSALLSSIEVNSTWIFFWISKGLISFAWDFPHEEYLHVNYLWRYVCKY